MTYIIFVFNEKIKFYIPFLLLFAISKSKKNGKKSKNAEINPIQKDYTSPVDFTAWIVSVF